MGTTLVPHMALDQLLSGSSELKAVHLVYIADASGLSCEYERTKDHALYELYGGNVEMLKDSDPALCKEACDDLEDGCKSFDFHPYSG